MILKKGQRWLYFNLSGLLRQIAVVEIQENTLIDKMTNCARIKVLYNNHYNESKPYNSIWSFESNQQQYWTYLKGQDSQ